MKLKLGIFCRNLNNLKNWELRLLDYIVYSNYFDRIINSEVYLRIDNAEGTVNKVAEIRMNIPGKELFAKKQC